MFKRISVVISLTLTFILAVEPLQTAHGTLLTEAERAALEASSHESENATQSDKKGNGFVRALKAPFKALGRLFGRKKKEPERIQNITEDDIARFNHTPGDLVRVRDIHPEKRVENSTTDNQRAALDSLQKGREQLNGGKVKEALMELSRAESLDPTLAEASSLIGIAYERKGLSDLARQALERAVAASDNKPEHLNNFGYFLYKQGDYKNATKYLKRAAKQQPDNPVIWNNLGLAQCERGKFDDAFKSFARASGEYKGRLNIAQRLEAEGYVEEAIKHLEKARAMQGGSIEVLDKLISLYEKVGNGESAASARSSVRALGTMATTPAKQLAN